ncbi:MAG: hypothetical protein WC870_02795 [Candidatus Paceibacterota bacterium]
MKKKKLKYMSFTVLIILIIFLGYEIKNKSDQDESDTTIPDTNTIDSMDWTTLSQKELANILSKEPDIYYIKDFGLKISQTIDLTGDGKKEGIVSGDGGNSDVSFILIRNSDNTISLAKQKNKDGSISPVSLYQIGRTMVNVNFKLLTTERGFYTASLSFDESADNSQTSHFKCTEDSIDAYVWNKQIEFFVWNQSLTTKYIAQICK